MPGERVGQRYGRIEGGQAGTVGQQPAHGDVLFAGGGELRPVVGDGGVQVQFASLHQEVGAGGRETLGSGKDVLEGVLGPRGAGGQVGDATPQVHHAPSAVVDTQRGAYFTVVTEVGSKGVTDSLETGVGGAVDGCHATSAGRCYVSRRLSTESG